MTNTFKYAYIVTQHGIARIEMFGTDTKISSNDLELKRRAINRDHFPAYVSRLQLKNQKTGQIVRDTKASTLPAEPLFTVAA